MTEHITKMGDSMRGLYMRQPLKMDGDTYAEYSAEKYYRHFRSGSKKMNQAINPG